jgi:hypothetical protein
MTVKIRAPNGTIYYDYGMNAVAQAEVLEWFKSNNITPLLIYDSGNIRHSYGISVTDSLRSYFFLFEEEYDATLFMLRWS